MKNIQNIYFVNTVHTNSIESGLIVISFTWSTNWQIFDKQAFSKNTVHAACKLRAVLVKDTFTNKDILLECVKKFSTESRSHHVNSTALNSFLIEVLLVPFFLLFLCFALTHTSYVISRETCDLVIFSHVFEVWSLFGYFLIYHRLMAFWNVLFTFSSLWLRYWCGVY